MSMQNKPIKYAFTARALIECIHLYGERIFTISDKIYVCEGALINQPGVRSAVVKDIHYEDREHYHLDEIAGIIYKHWFKIQSPPPFGLNDYKDELLILGKFAQTDPDNVCVIFSNLTELSYLNRVYSNDELLSVSEVEAYLKG